MNRDSFWKLLPILVLTVLLAACETDYTEEAMQKARAYALENTRMLPEVARKYIRFASPILQTTTVFYYYPMTLTEYDHLSRNIDFNPRRHPDNDEILSQFVWVPPELGYLVIVIGRSHADLAYWTPLRIVLKNVAPYRENYEKARLEAINYVTNNMLYLSRMERVRVRTSEAEVRETDFDLEYMFEEQLENSSKEWKRFLQTLRKEWDKRQYSVIWKTDDGKRRIVITGLGSVAGLKGWSPSCGMVIPAKQLDEYTVKIVVEAPDDPDKPTNKNAANVKEKVPDKSVPPARQSARKAGKQAGKVSDRPVSPKGSGK